jgi:hypothetical protein
LAWFSRTPASSYSRPAARHERDGAHTGAGTYAVVKRVPAAATLRVVGMRSSAPGASGWFFRSNPSQSYRHWSGNRRRMFGESFGAGVGDAARDPADVEAANERATSILYQQAVDSNNY